MKRNLFVVSSLIIATPLHAFQGKVYIVQKGETLSEIVHRYSSERIYSKHGALKKLLVLNPKIRNPDRVYPGQEITLPVEDELFSATVTSSEPVEAPVPEEPVTKEVTSRAIAEEDVEHAAQVFGGYGFTTLESVDTKNHTTAQLNTKRDVTLGASWNQKWTSSFSSFFTLSIRNLEFLPSTNSKKHLSGSDKTLFGMSAGGISHFGERASLKYSVGYSDQLFLYGINSSTINIDSLALPSSTLEAQYRIYTQGKTSFGVIGGVTYLLGGKSDAYKASSGTAFSTSFYLQRDFNGRALGLNVGYRERKQDTSVVDLREKSVFFNLNYSLPIFER
jgi:LysM repeat protein